MLKLGPIFLNHTYQPRVCNMLISIRLIPCGIIWFDMTSPCLYSHTRRMYAVNSVIYAQKYLIKNIEHFQKVFSFFYDWVALHLGKN